MGPNIHPTAIVDPKAEVADGAAVGPYAIVGGGVVLERGVEVGPHAVVRGNTVVGEGTRIFQFASVGEIPQDLKYKGEDTRLRIGKRNLIREYVTLHPGTVGGGGATTIGDGNFFMIGVHVAHDCHVGNGVVMANLTSLSGHVTIEDFAVLGGMVGVHQFTRIGTMAMVGGTAGVVQDVPPYTICSGNRARLYGLNLIGLKRRGVSGEVLRALRRAYQEVFLSGLPRREGVEKARRGANGLAEVDRFLTFIEKSERGVCRAGRRSPGSEADSAEEKGDSSGTGAP